MCWGILLKQFCSRRITASGLPERPLVGSRKIGQQIAGVGEAKLQEASTSCIATVKKKKKKRKLKKTFGYSKKEKKDESASRKCWAAGNTRVSHYGKTAGHNCKRKPRQPLVVPLGHRLRLHRVGEKTAGLLKIPAIARNETDQQPPNTNEGRSREEHTNSDAAVQERQDAAARRWAGHEPVAIRAKK